MKITRFLLGSAAIVSLSWLMPGGTTMAQQPPIAQSPDYFAPAPDGAGATRARSVALLQERPEPATPSPSDLAPVIADSEDYCEFEMGDGGGMWQRFVANQQDCWWGYPAYFQEPPLGARVYSCFSAQVARGNATRFTLYHYDFVQRTGRLTDRGRRQVAKFAAELESCPFGILIQTVPRHPQLDAARRDAVLAELESLGANIDATRVVTGHPRPAGLAGTEASQIQGNLDRQTSRGTGGPAMNESFRPSSGFSPSSGTSVGTGSSR